MTSLSGIAGLLVGYPFDTGLSPCVPTPMVVDP